MFAGGTRSSGFFRPWRTPWTYGEDSLTFHPWPWVVWCHRIHSTLSYWARHVILSVLPLYSSSFLPFFRPSLPLYHYISISLSLLLSPSQGPPGLPGLKGDSGIKGEKVSPLFQHIIDHMLYTVVQWNIDLLHAWLNITYGIDLPQLMRLMSNSPQGYKYRDAV